MDEMQITSARDEGNDRGIEKRERMKKKRRKSMLLSLCGGGVLRWRTVVLWVEGDCTLHLDAYALDSRLHPRLAPTPAKTSPPGSASASTPSSPTYHCCPSTRSSAGSASGTRPRAACSSAASGARGGRTRAMRASGGQTRTTRESEDRTRATTATASDDPRPPAQAACSRTAPYDGAKDAATATAAPRESGSATGGAGTRTRTPRAGTWTKPTGSGTPKTMRRAENWSNSHWAAHSHSPPPRPPPA